MTDPIQHVVLLMLENHSFDEMLGCFQQKYPDLDGIHPDAPPRGNNDGAGKTCYQLPKQNYCMRLDPLHETVNVLAQLEGGNGGFIRDFTKGYPSATQADCDQLMGYYTRGFLPALHTLAESFLICDRWFSSLPGPTWPNRFFTLSGTSSGRVKMPEGDTNPNLETIRDQTQMTIFDRLNEKNRSWAIHYYDFPSSLAMERQRRPENLSHYEKIDQFFDVCSIGKLPDFTFIEPKYFGTDQNDGHPPHNIMNAEKLLADVYNAIRSKPALWENTLLIVAFDEHGGFYDHVVPPAAVPPDDKRAEYDFRQLGVRVPAILVSPWVEENIDHTQYDHTSILRYLSDKWGLGPLGDRTEAAVSFAPRLETLKAPRTDTPGFIRVPLGELVKNDAETAADTGSPHHDALHVLADYISQEAKGAESPLLGGVVGVGSWLSDAYEASKSWVGQKLQLVGRSLTKAGEAAQAAKIAKTTGVADRLVNALPHPPGS